MTSRQDTPLKFDPLVGTSYDGYSPTAKIYRERNRGEWVYNPWTGVRRHDTDILSDPVGKLILPPGEDLLADTPKPEMLHSFILHEPIPMLLWCPECGERHIDEGDFVAKYHHTHACQYCGHVWRPAIVDTVGVQFLPGFKNT